MLIIDCGLYEKWVLSVVEKIAETRLLAAVLSGDKREIDSAKDQWVSALRASSEVTNG